MSSTGTRNAGPRLVTARTVAERLGISQHRVYELARTGDLPHVRLGRSMRFDPAAIESFIKGGGTGYDADVSTA